MANVEIATPTTMDVLQQLLESVDSMTMSEGVMLEVKNALKHTYDKINLPALPGMDQVNGDVIRTIQLDTKIKIHYKRNDSPNSREIKVKKYEIMRGATPNRMTIEVDGVQKILDHSKFKKILITTMTLLLCSSVEITNEDITELITYDDYMYQKKKEDMVEHELRTEDYEEIEEFDFCPSDYDFDQFYMGVYNMANTLIHLNL
jgi:hypothetical protein